MILTGCSKGNDDNLEPLPPEPTFQPASLLVYGNIQESAIIPTRATNKTWKANDAIGIYQVNTVQNKPTVSNLINNRKYILEENSTEGKFKPATDEHAVTLTETTTLHAYYPYKESLTSNLYNIDLTTQTEPEKIDLMIAKATATVATGIQTTAAHFSFKHRLCKIEVTVINEIKLDNFTKDHLKASIGNQYTQGTYNLASDTIIRTSDANAIITMKLPDDDNTEDNKLKAEAILFPNIPTDTTEGRIMTFNIGEKTYEYMIPANHVYKAGTKVIYDIKITPKELVVNTTITDWETDTVINPGGEPTTGEANESES